MPPRPLPRGRLRWFGRAQTSTEDGQVTAERAALVVFEDTRSQQQFLNSGAMDLQFEGDDADTLAFVLYQPPPG